MNAQSTCWKGGEICLTSSKDVAPDLTAAHEAWKTSNIPIDEASALKMVAALWMVTSHKNVTGEDFDLMASMYAKKVAQFPRGVVQDVFTAWTDTDDGEWFPALKKLVDLLKAQKAKHDKMGKALGAWGTPEDIERRIKIIAFDISRADMGHPPKGCDVPDYMEGLQGKALAAAMPKYKADMEKRVKALKQKHKGE